MIFKTQEREQVYKGMTVILLSDVELVVNCTFKHTEEERQLLPMGHGPGTH